MILIVSIAALVASALTLFSGFGLGTMLMPVIAIFLPIEIAVGITAVVHMLNNVFKLALLGTKANKSMLVSFGLPAVVAAFCGAYFLTRLSHQTILFEYILGSKTFSVSSLKLTIGFVILILLMIELIPAIAKYRFKKNLMPVGGLLSGFFGGLSGHQGAFRSMFLLKTNLSKEEFIATGATIAVMVDASRLAVYGVGHMGDLQLLPWKIVGAATIAAFVGSFVGSKLIKKTTIKSIQWIASILLFCIAVLMMGGLI